MVSTESLFDYLESGQVRPAPDDIAKDPLRTYAVMYTMYFLPATDSYISPAWSTLRVNKQQPNFIASLKIARSIALRLGKPELGLRLSSGIANVNHNIAAAAKLFRRVFEGPFSQDEKAIAASAICYLFLNYEDPSEPGDPLPFRHWCAAIGFAGNSCRLGLFSYTSLLVADTALSMGMGLGEASERIGILPDLHDILALFDRKNRKRVYASVQDLVIKSTNLYTAAESVKKLKWCKGSLIVCRNAMEDPSLYTLHLLQDNHTTTSR
ncbi:hypothetical protein NLJ89_g8933 [Agrocybe chaxingu]|uniref:Uncharacterized protein n=1 Tax=Agrocybe chaxingu TaxID=84603 RepID=A0A9W8MTM2_9AGAR|nr:hypothetical protein NLJ89_g8933 [Agrocybe chaxingu]